MPATAKKKPEPKTGRDARVDQIGLCKEITKHLADPLNDDVKASMIAKQLDLVEGDRFQGDLVPKTDRWIDPARFYRLLTTKKITPKQFLGAISVQTKAAATFLGAEQIAAISKTEPGTPSLTIKRKAGVEITLVQAIEGLASAA